MYICMYAADYMFVFVLKISIAFLYSSIVSWLIRQTQNKKREGVQVAWQSSITAAAVVYCLTYRPTIETVHHLSSSTMECISSKSREILIVGGGVFGTATALSFLKRPGYESSTITILDAARTLPNISAASSDTSRILRADYALKTYTTLVSDAQKLWRDLSNNGWGGQGRYHDARLVFTAQTGTESHVDGFLEESFANVKELADSGEYGFHGSQLRVLADKSAILRETSLPGVSGDFGYVNDNCGWVNADACMQYVYRQLRDQSQGRFKMRPNSKVRHLLYTQAQAPYAESCRGVVLEDGSQVVSDLVIVAAGAWTPSLVDLRGQAMATGQVLSYLSITNAEQAALNQCPIYFNASQGMFLTPPCNGMLKIGRHGFGYQNPTRVLQASGSGIMEPVIISTPTTGLSIPPEGEEACRDFLAELFPAWKNRNFTKTKLCWYCDTYVCRRYPLSDYYILTMQQTDW